MYELEQWGRALDEDSRWLYDRLAPGALLRLAGPEDTGRDEVATARAAYRRRLGETPGVVVSGSQDEVTSSIVMEEWSPSGRGRAIDEALRQLERKWETPDGVPLILAVDVWRHARELALGFWYRWEPAPPEPWLSARRAWAARARSVLARSRRYDTEAQVRAAMAGDPALEAWDAVRGSYSYSLVPEWFDDSVIAAVLEWATVHDGIVWVGHAAIGERLEARGLPYYGAKGLRGRSPIERAEGAIAASIGANAEGRNLQNGARIWF